MVTKDPDFDIMDDNSKIYVEFIAKFDQLSVQVKDVVVYE